MLGELIAALEAEDLELVMPLGFNEPHSYRGYYDELAFEPAENVTVRDMLEAARSAVGATYAGYKGGRYKMGDWSLVYLAEYGDTGEEIGPTLLRYMIADAKRRSASAAEGE